MNPQIIYKTEQLLNRYYNGESTAEEEAELEAILRKEKAIPAHIEADAELFLQMCGASALSQQRAEEEAKSHLPEGFSERLDATLGRLAEEEKRAAAPSIQPRKRNLMWIRTAAACASFIVVLGAAIGYMAIPSDPFTDTCSTPEQAEFQLNRALKLVNAYSQASLAQSRIGGEEIQAKQLTASKFISFE